MTDKKMTLDFWITNHFPSDTLAGLRVGQSYCNRVISEVRDPVLFYETDDYKAWERIYSLYESLLNKG